MKIYLILLLFTFTGNLCLAQEKNDKTTESKSAYSSVFKPRFQSILEVGYGVGDGIYGRNNIRMNLIYGYRFSPHFSMGLGTGLRYQANGRVLQVPVFADFRANLSAQKVSPYIGFGIGSTFAASNFHKAGFLFSPSAGVSFPVFNKHKMNIGIGYEIQQMQIFRGRYYDASTGFESLKQTRHGDSMSLNIGFTF